LSSRWRRRSRHQDHADDRKPEDDALNAGKARSHFRVQRLRERNQDDAADHRSPDRADAAEHRNRQRLRRDQHAEHRLRGHDQQHHGIEAADRAGDGAAEADRAQLPGERVDAGGFRRCLVLLDGEQRHTEPGAFNALRDQDGADQDHQSK
jgi:hypothetical protein